MPVDPSDIKALDEALDILRTTILPRYRRNSPSMKKLTVAVARLNRARVPSAQLWKAVDELGAVLAERLTKRDYLATGPYKTRKPHLSKLNEAVTWWQAAFEALMSGKRLGPEAVAEIRKRLAYTHLEPHHLVEWRILTTFPNKKVAKILLGHYPTYDDGLTIGIFADAHRGVRFLAGGPRTAAAKKILEVPNPSSQNLTQALLAKFVNSKYFAGDANPDLDVFLIDLAELYKAKAPNMYSGFLKGLKEIAEKTGTDIAEHRWPKP